MKEVNANPSPFHLNGGDIGLLMIHGFTGSASEYALIGPYLNERGTTVSVPLLPGHGTTPQDLNQAKWQDWVVHAELALKALQHECKQVFVCGQSMGALIALQLATHHPTLAGVVTYSPPMGVTDWRANLLRVLRHVTSTMSKPDDIFADPDADGRLFRYSVYPTAAADELIMLMRQTMKNLVHVISPLLVVEAEADPMVKANSGEILMNSVSSRDKKLVTLHNSGHILTLDADWEVAAQATWQFIREHVEDNERVPVLA